MKTSLELALLNKIGEWLIDTHYVDYELAAMLAGSVCALLNLPHGRSTDQVIANYWFLISVNWCVTV